MFEDYNVSAQLPFLLISYLCSSSSRWHWGAFFTEGGQSLGLLLDMPVYSLQGGSHRHSQTNHFSLSVMELCDLSFSSVMECAHCPAEKTHYGHQEPA
uniref:Uncharacterized protein n=1 Tax=Knipowitschia caucasica TaxID=637954 RepID=A0AAV2LJE8_KNICA